VENRIAEFSNPEALAGMRIAVMGCEVNGPGEARSAHIGIAGGRESALLFKGGEVVGRYPVAEIVDALMAELGGTISDKTISGLR